MKIVRIAAIVAGALALLVFGYWLYTEQIANPRVVRELIEQPDGERARKAMLLTLPSGRRIPVNYLREEGKVYAGADGGPCEGDCDLRPSVLARRRPLG